MVKQYSYKNNTSFGASPDEGSLAMERNETSSEKKSIFSIKKIVAAKNVINYSFKNNGSSPYVLKRTNSIQNAKTSPLLKETIKRKNSGGSESE